MSKNSIEKSLDFRYYSSSKALYTVSFYKAYAEYIKPIVLSAMGMSKKALIFDCDNTLWKGVLGEDGLGGIKMSEKTPSGAVFAEVQDLALALAGQGVILGICSKNNPEDVEEVIANHPDMKIRDEHVAVKKVNWNDKVSNLKEIAEELNIGLDSMVFVEDSDFEANYVRRLLPEVTVLKVPDVLHLYPAMLRDNMNLFYRLSISGEDAEKTKMYKDEARRNLQKENFGDMGNYLKSLGLKLKIYIDEKAHLSRMAQLTQKTNQFNLTTRRYTESDMERFVTGEGHSVFAFGLEDKFGDYGMTGLCITRLDKPKKYAVIDTLLMSCRVIGRDIEFPFVDFVIKYLDSMGIETLKAKYVKTLKNSQVSDFFDKVGFRLGEGNEREKFYKLDISKYKSKNIDYVELERK